MPEQTTDLNNPVTLELLDRALDRLKNDLRIDAVERTQALEKFLIQRLTEHERQIRELNNSHEKAVEAKRLTDEAATRIQERTVTKEELEKWKTEVNKRLDMAAGAAKTWALIGAVAGSVFAGVIVGVASKMLAP